MQKKICCVTGHRLLAKEEVSAIKEALLHAVDEAVQEGYTHFISGFADGVDLYFAQCVLEHKKRANLTLEAAIPYRNRLQNRERTFQRLLQACDVVSVLSEQYSPYCYTKRNQYMVEYASLVIAIYDGRAGGGTKATIAYAKRLGKRVEEIVWAKSARIEE